MRERRLALWVGGSGISTLMQALFHIDPAARMILKIALDVINISSIGLRDLQSKLSIIPQDATKFEGLFKVTWIPSKSTPSNIFGRPLINANLEMKFGRKKGSWVQ